MMVTGSHGVRMQYDYTGDVPGLAGAVSAASPRWLRLTRSGDTITGYDSADGTHWTRVGDRHPGRAAAGRCRAACSPPHRSTCRPRSARRSVSGGASEATGVFDHVSLGTWPGGCVGRRRHRRREAAGAGQSRDSARPRARSPSPGAATSRRRCPGRPGSASRSRRRSIGHVRRADRGGRRGGDVHDRRVPARPDPGHARREPPGAAGCWRPRRS